VDVFWHYYISDYYELVSDAHFLQYLFEEIATLGS